MPWSKRKLFESRLKHFVCETEDHDILSFLQKEKEAIEKNSKAKYPTAPVNHRTIGWSKGQKFYKVWTTPIDRDHKSAYMFIDMDGNIYKAAGWGVSAKGIRGNIETMDVTHHDGGTGFLYR